MAWLQFKNSVPQCGAVDLCTGSSYTKKNREDVMTSKTTRPPPEDAILLSSGTVTGGTKGTHHVLGYFPFL